MSRGYNILVSILVLLDVALKEGYSLKLIRCKSSFNPCSLGCCSESLGALSTYKLKNLVSILVLLDVALKERSMSAATRFRLKFQSLFSWMLLWKPKWVCEFCEFVSWVSILVLLDVALKVGDRLAVQCGRRIVSILVLLDVALKAGSITRFGWRLYVVSILVLLDVALKECGSIQKRVFTWVSILVLLDVALKA